MEIAKIIVKGTTGFCCMRKRIPAGLVGGTVSVTFEDPQWVAISKTVIFRGAETRIAQFDGSNAIIPAETVAKPGSALFFGIWGYDAETGLQLPLIEVRIGIVETATDPEADPGTDPSLPVWVDLQNRVENLESRPAGSGIDVSGAVPGQTVKIATVDDKGRPTAWDPADFPESGGNVDLAGYATEQYVKDYAQPKGNYLSEVPEGYAKSSEIPKKPEDIGALPNTYTPPNQTAAQVGADPAGTAATAVSQHNTANNSHGDIRLELKAINDRLTAFFDSDDQTLDELSEIVAYITNNKTLIESITTSKVNVSDIINNLTTNVTGKPLSAAQGVVLKGLIDTLSASLSNYQPKGDYALASAIPTKVSQIENDSKFITASGAPVQTVNGKTGAVVLDAASVGARSETWMPTHSDVGAEKSGTAATAVSGHNTNTDAHNDIRLLITALTTRLDALANSDDETLDQMAEVVAYIKSNRNLIEQITTGKVSVTDIVNNLSTNVTNKPLSAAQGVALKALIDAITIPTKLSQLVNDKGYITGYTETDPTVPEWAKAASKPSYSKSEVGLGNVENVKQYSASNPPPYPVTSVNGKTGAVIVDVPSVPSWAMANSKPSYTASEVGAVPTTSAVTVTGIDADGVSHSWTMYGVAK